MVAALNRLTTILNATSPLVLSSQDNTVLSQQSNGTPLTPPGTSQSATTIAYSYVPPGNVSLLARAQDNVILTPEAGVPPAALRVLREKWPPDINDIYLNKNVPGVRKPPLRNAPAFGGIDLNRIKFTPDDFSRASKAFDLTQKFSAPTTFNTGFDVSV